MKRKVLGKGIEAIISNKISPEHDAVIQEIGIDDIQPNPFQPRKDFDKDKIKSLALSIKEAGLIQPVVVYKQEEKFFLLIGERRWRAAQYLKWKKIPVIVKDLSLNDVMIGALIENIQREDLNAVEIAEGIELLMKKFDLTQEQASEKLGMNRVTVTNYLRLLKLPKAVKQGIISGELTQGHARPLLGLNNSEDILNVFSTVLRKKLSVRQTESLVKNFYIKKEKETQYDPDIKKTEENLTRLFSTKVKLNYSKNGKGKMEIFFSSLDEFDRIYKMIFKE